MDCPYCGKEMRVGIIPSGSRWVDKSTMDTWEVVRLCGGFENGPTAFFCPGCRQIILPVPEIEGVLAMVERKLFEAGNKIDAAQKQWEARRTQAKEQKKKKEFGSKDPWEL